MLAEPMKRWDLEDMLPTTELLVSELVTNAVRYSHGDVTLRLVDEKALVCEVLDNSAALPRLRQANSEDENGRGLQVVRLLQALGRAPHPAGKVVWCEQPLPGVPARWRTGSRCTRARCRCYWWGYRACAFAVIMWVLLRPVSLA